MMKKILESFLGLGIGISMSLVPLKIDAQNIKNPFHLLSYDSIEVQLIDRNGDKSIDKIIYSGYIGKNKTIVVSRDDDYNKHFEISNYKVLNGEDLIKEGNKLFYLDRISQEFKDLPEGKITFRKNELYKALTYVF